MELRHPITGMAAVVLATIMLLLLQLGSAGPLLA